MKSTLLSLLLVAVCLRWTEGTSSYSHPHFVGNRSVITHLMEWKYEDIAAECERFLGPHGYGGVQLSPVHECAVLPGRPWYERYQPVSYKLKSRSGTEQQLRDMVHKCNKVGVRIYVDIVLNHMTGGGNGYGTAGSTWNGDSLQYPGVPFGPNDFHNHDSCPTKSLDVDDYNNAQQARNCRLSGLRDINQSKEYVRDKQAEFLNHLIDMGVAGFRSDASKHMWPADLQAIYSKLHHLNTEYFPANSKPFIYHEIIYYGGSGITASEYTSLGRAIEFRYHRELSNAFRGHNKLMNLKNFGQPWSFVPSDDALVMIDSHDLQRGQTGELGLNIAYFESKLLKMSTAFMLAWPYGVPRVMSSYSWTRNVQNGKDLNQGHGPPTEGGENYIKTVVPKADLTCNDGWVCEHRWRQIYNMVAFRNVAGNEPVSHWWDNGNYQIAFGRGNKAFIAINDQAGSTLDTQLATGLSAGTYCDVVTGSVKDNKCTGKSITVNSSGHAHFKIDANDQDPFIAIHIHAKLH